MEGGTQGGQSDYRGGGCTPLPSFKYTYEYPSLSSQIFFPVNKEQVEGEGGVRPHVVPTGRFCTRGIEPNSFGLGFKHRIHGTIRPKNNTTRGVFSGEVDCNDVQSEVLV